MSLVGPAVLSRWNSYANRAPCKNTARVAACLQNDFLLRKANGAQRMAVGKGALLFLRLGIKSSAKQAV